MRAYWPRFVSSRRGLVHGDFWPGNTLWLRGRLSGVVDWEQVRYGDPCQDVACCRLDLTLLFGPETADQFLLAYLAAAGEPVRQLFFWELYIAASALEDVEHWVDGYYDLGRTDVTPEIARDRLERFAERALRIGAALLGG